jgi:hypothetical protein
MAAEWDGEKIYNPNQNKKLSYISKCDGRSEVRGSAPKCDGLHQSPMMRVIICDFVLF